MGSCECPFSIRVLEHIGAEDAADHHRAGAAGNPGEYSRASWFRHMRDEDTKLFPLFSLLGRRYAAAIRGLYFDHDIFRAELTTYGRIVSMARLRKHSAIEEQLSILLIERGIVRLL